VHDAADPAVNCSGCHPTAVDAVSPWDKTCEACHETTTPATHPTPGTTHLGTDAAMRTYSSQHIAFSYYGQSTYTHGCSPTPADGQLDCHDISSLAALHGDLPDKGCKICHSPDRAVPAGGNECLTCHGISDTMTPYTEDSTPRTVTLTPNSDFGSTATITRVGGAENWSTLTSADGNSSYLQFTSLGRASLGFSTSAALPANAAITNVRVYYLARKATSPTGTSRMGASLNVGGTDYDYTGVAPTYSTTNYTTYSSPLFSTNPKTGIAWKLVDLTDAGSTNGLRAIGVNQNNNISANICVTQVYAVVTYTLRDYYSTPPVGSKTYHEIGRWLMNEPSLDTTPGQLLSTGYPAHGYYTALYYQYCYDRCHAYPNDKTSAYGDMRTYSPYQKYAGNWMWYSVAGDAVDYFGNASPPTRTLTLKSLAVPAGTTTLAFMTNYRLTGDNGYVEASTDGGGNWSTLTGTVGGVSKSVYTGSASGWVAADYDLSAYAGQTIQLRFRYVNGPTSGQAGWGFDNLTITNGATTIFADDAEGGESKWESYHWARAHLAFPFMQ